MADRLRWWVIPAALLVMARVVTLGEPAIESQPPVVQATGKPRLKDVHEASSTRWHLPADQLDTNSDRAFVIALPNELAGLRAHCTLWRRTATGREATPWLEFTSTVREDGTVPISGLAVGRYDVAVSAQQASSTVEFAVEDAVAPGRATVAAPAPLR